MSVAEQQRGAPTYAELVEVLRAFGTALDASDSDHENFMDSGADVVELLWYHEGTVRGLLKRLEERDA